MIIEITLKDPDGVGDSVREALVLEIDKIEGLNDQERDQLVETRQEAIWDDISKFIECQEYVTIEIDTEAQTARVVPV